MKLSIPQLSLILNISIRSTKRLSTTLKLSVTNNLITILSSHPLYKSIKLCKGSAKPLYTIKELSNLWEWRKSKYSTDSVRKLLAKYNVPIYNKGKGKKGYVFLKDIIKLNQTTD